jgi:hypothetical protein
MSQGFTSQLPVPLPVAQGGTGVTTSTGTGNTVLSTSPTLTTPRIGQINDINGNASLTTTATPSAVNYINCVNNVTGYYPNFSAAGTDTNIDFAFNTKGTGVYRFISSATTSPFVIYNGTGNQHNTTFAFSNTAASRTVTFPDATGNIVLSSSTVAQTGNVGAWVNFDGAAATPTIRASGNVTSITDNGTGDYTINFTTAFADANYAVAGMVRFTPAGSALITGLSGSATWQQTGSVNVATYTTTGGLADALYANIICVR